jgi:1-phosphofructokinase
VVLSGSLPPGVGADFYARLTARLRAGGVRVALDSSDASLELGLAAGPDVVKPNRSELAAVTGRSLHTMADVIEAARLVRDKGAGMVLVSLGADGAVLVDDVGVLHAEAPVAVPRSAVGAGDALLAGFLSVGGCGVEALCEGVAWGAGATSLPGSRMPGSCDINRLAVHVHPRVDLDRALSHAVER